MKHLPRTNFVLAAVLIVIVVLASLPFPFYSHQWHKLLHVLGAILFIGNIVGAAVWMALALVSRQTRVIHFAAKTVNQADLLFTIPGVLLLFINGLVLAPSFGGGSVFGASWVVAGMALLILSGLLWAGFLLRYQTQLVELSATGEQVSGEFFNVFRKWSIWGSISTALAIIALILIIGRAHV